MFGNKMDKIAKLADKNDAVKLLGMLNDKDEKVVLAAIDALGRCNGDDAFNAGAAGSQRQRRRSHPRRAGAGQNGAAQGPHLPAASAGG